MIKKKGFTLTEVLVTIVILGIMLVVAVPSVRLLRDKFKNNYYEELDSSVKEIGKTYYKDNSESKPINLLEITEVSYDKLVSNKYIDKINIYGENAKCGGKMVIMKATKSYIYKNCIECRKNGVLEYPDKEFAEKKVLGENNENNLCVFESGDKIFYTYKDLPEKPKIYLHINNYTIEQLKKEICIPAMATRCPANTTQEKCLNDKKFLYQLEDDSTETMRCPINISSIKINKIGEYTIIYPKDASQTEEKKIDIFQHPEVTLKNPINKINDDEDVIINNEINLSIDDVTTFGSDYNSSFVGYQYNSGKGWNDITCKLGEGEKLKPEDTCKADLSTLTKNSIDGSKIYFRVVGNSNKQNTVKQFGKSEDKFNIAIGLLLMADETEDGINAKVRYLSNQISTITNPTRNYKISFDLNSTGATAVTTEKMVSHKLDGWYTEATGGTKVASNESSPILQSNVNNYTDESGRWIRTDKTTLYAHWAPEVITLPKIEKNGYDCKWNTKSDGKGTSYDGESSYNLTKDIKLYAHCTPKPYTITLNGNGATTQGSLKTSVSYGDTKLSEITNPKKEYILYLNNNSTGISIPNPTSIISCNLDGWYTSASGGTKVASNSINPLLQSNVSSYTDSSGKWIKNSNATLYAHWTNKSFTLPKVNKTGYSCKWNTKSDGSGTSYNMESSITLTNDTTLYLVCSANTYTISYDLAGGSFGEHHPTTATYNSSFTVSTPSKSEMEFTGWTITGMDSIAHTYGSNTSTNTTLNNVTSTSFKNLRQTSGTVYFKANWKQTVKPIVEFFATDKSLSWFKYKEYDGTWTTKDIQLNAFVNPNTNTINKIEFSYYNEYTKQNKNYFEGKSDSCGLGFKNCDSGDKRSYIELESDGIYKVKVRVTYNTNVTAEYDSTYVIKIDKTPPYMVSNATEIVNYTDGGWIRFVQTGSSGSIIQDTRLRCSCSNNKCTGSAKIIDRETTSPARWDLGYYGLPLVDDLSGMDTRTNCKLDSAEYTKLNIRVLNISTGFNSLWRSQVPYTLYFYAKCKDNAGNSAEKFTYQFTVGL